MNRATFTMGATLALAIMSLITTDLYLPSLPAITELMHTTAEMGKLTIGVFVLGLAISPLILGTLADRFGRKKMLLIASGIGLIGTLIAACSFNIWMLLFARLVQGFGFGGCLSLARTIINDLYEGEKLAHMAALLGLCIACGPAIAPVIGSYMAVHFGWRSVFVFVFVVVALVWLLITQFMHETAKELHDSTNMLTSIMSDFKELLSSKQFISYAVVSSTSVSAVFLYATVSPFILQTIYHLTPIQFGWSMAVITSMVIIGRFANMMLVKRMTTEQIVMFCSAIMLSGSVLFCVLALITKSYITAIILPMLIIILGASIIPMNAMVGALKPFKHIGGAAGAIYGCLQMMGTFLMTFIGSVFVSNAMVLAIVYLLISSIAFSVFYQMRRKQPIQAFV